MISTLAAPAPDLDDPMRARTSWAQWTSLAAATWAVLFAAVHVYWLAGGMVGLPSGMALRDNLPLLVVDVIAIPALLVAGYLAWLLPRNGTRWLNRRVERALNWGIAAVLLAHSLPTVPDWAEVLLTDARVADLPELERFTVAVYEPCFLTGGLLFLAAAVLSRLGRSATSPL